MRAPNRACRRRAGSLCAAALALVAPSACTAPASNRELHRENAQLRERLAQREQTLLAQQAAIEELNQRLAAARGITPEQIKLLNSPERLVIETLTGGTDLDGKPGDDGVAVYVKPLDRDGDALKCVGALRIELFDLSREGAPTRIGLCETPAERLRESWYGQFLTQHYTVKCAWQTPPQRGEVTVRATFVEALTQRVLTAQVVVTVRTASGTRGGEGGPQRNP